MRQLLVTLLLLCSPLPVHGQGSSPIQDLLTSSRTALNDLRYDGSAEISRAVLALPTLRREERIQALQLLAGALYPEIEEAQKRDSALDVLRQMVRIAPSAALLQQVVWQGLESLLAEAKRTTFGLSVLPPATDLSLAIDGAAVFEVAVSRGASVTLRAIPSGGGASVRFDSTGLSDGGPLRMVLATPTGAVLPSGAYDLIVTAVELGGGDTLTVEFGATITAPILELIAPLAAFDSTAILPEVTAPKRAKGIIGGILVAAGTIAARSLAYGGTLGPEAERDGRAVSIGVLMGLGAGAGVWLLDKGKPMPANISSNHDKRVGYASEIVARQAANEQRLRDFRVGISVEGEPKP